MDALTEVLNSIPRLVGEPPLRYLSRWRMHKAIEMIRENRLTTAEIASLVGYESEAAFSKAFKKWNGQGPGAYRRSAAGRSGIEDQSVANQPPGTGGRTARRISASAG